MSKTIKICIIIVSVIAVFWLCYLVGYWVGQRVHHNEIDNANFTDIATSIAPQKFSSESFGNGVLVYGTSKEDVVEAYGVGSSGHSYVDSNTSDNMSELLYDDGLILLFRNNKLCLASYTNDKYNFTGIKVGDTVESVKNKFYIDENNNLDVKDSSGTVIGNYIYGNTNIYNLEDSNITDVLQYAYKSNGINEDSEGMYDYTLRYVYMAPPYINQKASLNDNVYQLLFQIKDDKVTCITWIVGPVVQ